MSQNDEILAHLKKGLVLTPLVALERFQCLRLAARIGNLRDKGHRIKTERYRAANGKHYALYWMEQE